MIDRLTRPFLESGSGSGEDGNGGNGGGSQEGSQSGAPGGQGSGQESESKNQMVPASDLSKVREEAAKYRTERNAAQKELDELKKGQMSEKEKAEKERDDAMKSFSETAIENRTLRARLIAGEVGIVSAAREDAARLLDWDRIEDPTDDKQIKKALETLTKDRPYLLGTDGGADGGAGGSRQAGSGGMNDQIRAAAGRR